MKRLFAMGCAALALTARGQQGEYATTQERLTTTDIAEPAPGSADAAGGEIPVSIPQIAYVYEYGSASRQTTWRRCRSGTLPCVTAWGRNNAGCSKCALRGTKGTMPMVRRLGRPAWLAAVATEEAARHRKLRPSSEPLRVVAFARYPHFQPVELLAQQDLARQTAGRLHIGGEVEHVLFLLAGFGQASEPFAGDDHMAGRAGHLALARPLERHTGALPHFEQAIARRGLDRALFALACNEGDLDGVYPCCDAATIIRSAASSS